MKKIFNITYMSFSGFFALNALAAGPFPYEIVPTMCANEKQEIGQEQLINKYCFNDVGASNLKVLSITEMSFGRPTDMPIVYYVVAESKDAVSSTNSASGSGQIGTTEFQPFSRQKRLEAATVMDPLPGREYVRLESTEITQVEAREGGFKDMRKKVELMHPTNTEAQLGATDAGLIMLSDENFNAEETFVTVPFEAVISAQ